MFEDPDRYDPEQHATSDLAHDPESRGLRAQRPLGGWSVSPVVLT